MCELHVFNRMVDSKVLSESDEVVAAATVSESDSATSVV